MIEFAKDNKLVDLGTFMDMDVLRDYSPTWLDLGTYKGKFCGVFISADLKSLIWYSPKAFAAAGYTIPATWEELIALSDKMVADGKTPWLLDLKVVLPVDGLEPIGLKILCSVP